MLDRVWESFQRKALSWQQKKQSPQSYWSNSIMKKSTKSQSIYIICLSSSRNMAVCVAGITSDANSLVAYSRNEAQKYLFTYNESIPCEQLVQKLCDLKQGYTQYGGVIFFQLISLVFVRMAFPFCMLGMTINLGFNFTSLTLLAIILVGKRHA
jgi:hypothetical protein